MMDDETLFFRLTVAGEAARLEASSLGLIHGAALLLWLTEGEPEGGFDDWLNPDGSNLTDPGSASVRVWRVGRAQERPRHSGRVGAARGVGVFLHLGPEDGYDLLLRGSAEGFAWLAQRLLQIALSAAPEATLQPGRELDASSWPLVIRHTPGYAPPAREFFGMYR